MSSFKTKIDKRKIGIIVGLILPILTFFIYINIAFSNTSYSGIYGLLVATSDSRFGPFTYALIPNFVLFYLSNYQLRIDKFSYGMVISTLILSIFVVFSLLF